MLQETQPISEHFQMISLGTHVDQAARQQSCPGPETDRTTNHTEEHSNGRQEGGVKYGNEDVNVWQLQPLERDIWAFPQLPRAETHKRFTRVRFN